MKTKQKLPKTKHVDSAADLTARLNKLVAKLQSIENLIFKTENEFLQVVAANKAKQNEENRYDQYKD